MTLSQETLEALEKQTMQAQIAELQKQLGIQKQELKDIQDERDRALKWGIMTLGAAVLGMGTWFANLVTGGHIK